MLWVDKYRPKKLENLTYHDNLTNMLKKMLKSGNFPHLLLYGPSGAGKKTRVMSILYEVFGKASQKIKTEHRTFKVRSRKIDITTLGSNYHIEMNPSDAGIYDRIIVQDIIKEIASSAVLSKNDYKFKVVVLNEVDKLTKDAQHGLRRTMEKYMSSCRIIMQCESVSKLIDPLRSRCLSIRVSAPTNDQIVKVIKNVCEKERINIDNEFAKEISIKSERNLRRALLILQACATESNELYMKDDFKDNNNNNNNNSKTNKNTNRIKITPWELFINELGKLIIEEQSPQRVLLIRTKLYELLSNCIPSNVIFKKLTIAIMNNVDDTLRYDIAKWSAYHEHRCVKGAKQIIHLEAFVVKVMSIYKKWVIDNFSF